jgi:hypothetical protein
LVRRFQRLQKLQKLEEEIEAMEGGIRAESVSELLLEPLLRQLF